MLLVAALLLAFATPTPHAAQLALVPGCQTTPLYSSATGNTTISGTLNFTSFLTPQTVTTAISCGPQNAWYVTVQETFQTANVAASTYTACIASTTPGYTLVDGLTNGANTCLTGASNTPTGQIGGSNYMGGASPGNAIQGSSQLTQAHVTVPNNFTFTAVCWVATATAGGANPFGYCSVEADPI